MTALVSYGCHNEVPQTGWLKTTGIYCLTVLEAGSPKFRCHRAVRSLRLQGENSFHASLLASGASQQSLMFLGLLLHHASPCYWFQMAFSVCFPFTGHRIRMHHNPLWTHPNWITSAKTLLLNKIPFTGSRGRNSHIFWEEHNTTHNWDCELEMVSITILNCHAVWDFRNYICLIFYRHVRNRISWLMKCF